jgi:hypothetical protein
MKKIESIARTRTYPAPWCLSLPKNHPITGVIRDRDGRPCSEICPFSESGHRDRLSFVMLRSDIHWQNPVKFVVEVSAVLTLAFILRAVFGAGTGPVSIGNPKRLTSQRIG